MSVTIHTNPDGNGPIYALTSINTAPTTWVPLQVTSEQFTCVEDLRGTDSINSRAITTQTTAQIMATRIAARPEVQGRNIRVNSYGVTTTTTDAAFSTNTSPAASSVISAWIINTAAAGTLYTGSWNFTSHVWGYMSNFTPIDTRNHLPRDAQNNTYNGNNIRYTLTQTVPVGHEHSNVDVYWVSNRVAGARIGHDLVQVRTTDITVAPELAYVQFSGNTSWGADILGFLSAHHPLQGSNFHYGVVKAQDGLLGTTYVSSNPGVGVAWSLQPGIKAVTNGQEVISTQIDNLLINSQLAATKQAWSSQSAWQQGAVNGLQPYNNIFDGRKDLVVPLMIDIPVNITDLEFTVETRGVDAADIQVKLAKSGTHSTPHRDDVVTFSSNAYSMFAMQTPWYSSLYSENEPVIIPSDKQIKFPTKFINPTRDPVYRADVTNLELIINSENPNVALSLEAPINWGTTNHFIDTMLTAKIINPAQAAWTPEVHNGHYYLNQDEYYLSAEEGAQGLLALHDEPKEIDVDYKITANSQWNYNAETVTFLDTDKIHFIAGTFANEGAPLGTISTVVSSDSDIALAHSGSVMLSSGVYLSGIKEFQRSVASWGRVVWSSTELHGSRIDVHMRSSTDNLSWSDWSQATQNTVIPLPLGKFVQYRLTLTKGQRQEIFERRTPISFANFETTSNINILDNAIRMANPSLPTAIYESKPIDLGINISSLGSFSANIVMPLSGGSILLETSTGASNVGPWSTWVPVSNNTIMSPVERFIRYRVQFTPGEGPVSPVVADMAIVYNRFNNYDESPLLHSISLTGNLNAASIMAPVVVYQKAKLPLDQNLHLISQRTPEEIIKQHLLYSSLTNVIPISYLIDLAEYSTLNPTTLNFTYNTDGKSQIKASSTITDIERVISRKLKVTNNTVVTTPSPQQGSPVIVTDANGKQLRQVVFFDDQNKPTLSTRQEITGDGGSRYVLNFDEVDPASFSIINSNLTGLVQNNVVTLSAPLGIGERINVTYTLLDSFYIEPMEDSIKIVMHNPIIKQDGSIDIRYETSKTTALKNIEYIDINPLRNVHNNGFLYLTDTIPSPASIQIKSNPSILYGNGYDRATLRVLLLDSDNNPASNQRILLNSTSGQLIPHSEFTNAQGIVVATYIAPARTGLAIITATHPETQLTARHEIKLISEANRPRLAIIASTNQIIYMINNMRYWSTQCLIEAHVIDDRFQKPSGYNIEFSTVDGRLSPVPSLDSAQSIILNTVTGVDGVARCYLNAPLLAFSDPANTPMNDDVIRVSARAVVPNSTEILEASLIIPLTVLSLYRN